MPKAIIASDPPAATGRTRASHVLIAERREDR
jgi:hypothetical protein